MPIAAAILGCLCGILTGLIPGIHVNTVTALLLAASASCASLGLDYTALLAFVCALAISHTFFDVIPGLFLGVPGDETFALLPGHRLVRNRQGQLALRLSVVGSATGLTVGVVVVVGILTFGNAIGWVEGILRPWMFWVLAAVAIILIVSENRRFWALLTFLASGLLGLAVFASPLVAGGTDAAVNALFPSLAGLFGVAGLLHALSTDSSAPVPPEANGQRPSGKEAVWPSLRGSVAGLLVGLLPGLGAANAATLLLLVEKWRRKDNSRDQEDRGYLVTTSSLNTAEALFSIAALHLIGRSRSGASVAVEQIMGGNVGRDDLFPITVSMLGAGLIATFALWHGGAWFASRFDKVDPQGLNWGVIAFLASLTGWLVGVGGLAILAAATAVGLIPIRVGVRRAQLMGFFIVPVMLFYSGHQVELVDLFSVGQRLAPSAPSITLASVLLATGASLAVGAAVYFVTLIANAKQGAQSQQIVRLVVGIGASLVLAVALLGGGYPPDYDWGKIPLEPPPETSGRIIRVIDGDTVEVAASCRRFTVRLMGIDAPEVSSAAGNCSRDWARLHLSDDPITWRPVGIGVYGRFLGEVYLQDGTFINADIVRQGYARADTRYPYHGLDGLLQLELGARNAGLGIWGECAEASARAQTNRELPPEVAKYDDNENGRITCAEARNHRIAPVRREDPAYRYMRDGDGDGVVCD